MSPDWRATTNRFRSTNEGKNGGVKDPTAERIGTKGRPPGQRHGGQRHPARLPDRRQQPTQHGS
jgi:hypothetical protein